ncbi:hypothetical protein EAM_0530 [Erwinia amylovora ATCC 49946]|nr:hypothetical protein EAM_0530 [Erwinia amylovora ATCC 49946]CDK16413.1 hypothetical protein LA635_2789 [Erwinia amylovora LA635]CDK19779.1 hypothetical protein LA636_2787 [Erwinia amylovora LA636]CDK23151.1 hypothetical protein LA637_2791 [Erwinia amylovora LA637]
MIYMHKQHPERIRNDSKMTIIIIYYVVIDKKCRDVFA